MGDAIKIAPSILSADFRCLERDVMEAERAGADLFHLDVMDGHFVPNISFGALIVDAVRKLTGLHLNAHLMIEEPMRYLDDFVKAGADSVTIHAEIEYPLEAMIDRIRSRGVLAGVSLNPETPVSAMKEVLSSVDMILIMSVHPGFGGQSFIPSSLEKVEELSKEISRLGVSPDIQIDGGISVKTAPMAVKAGANVLVAGSAIFGSGSITENIRLFRESCRF